jgi:hypothetical protein
MSDAKTPKPLSLGKFKPLTPDTSLARISDAALPGKCTVEQIAEKVRLRPDQVAHRHCATGWALRTASATRKRRMALSR